MHLYHLSHIDLDGYGCQLVTSLYFKKRTYSNTNYGAEATARLDQIIRSIESGEDTKAMILVTDVNLTMDEASFLDDAVNGLRKSGKEITLQVLDHHAGGADVAAKHDWYYLDDSRCATKITHEYCLQHFKNPGQPTLEWLSPFVDAINAIDIWHEDDPLFEFGKVCARLVNDSREISRMMFDLEHREYKLWLLKEAAKLLKQDEAHIRLDDSMHRLKKKYLRGQKPKDTMDNLASNFVVELLENKKEGCTLRYGKHQGFLSYALGSISNIANLFLKRNPDFHFFIDVSPGGRCGLRANNKIDVSRMAKTHFNGGGHPNASGGKIGDFKESFSYAQVKSEIERIISQKAAP